jgi:hypothetical protein
VGLDEAKIALHPMANPPEVLATFLAVNWSERNRPAQTPQIGDTPNASVNSSIRQAFGTK